MAINTTLPGSIAVTPPLTGAEVIECIVGPVYTKTTAQAIANLAASEGITQLTLDGATSGSTIVIPTAIASGTLTLPAATDTLVGKATTDTLTNKTLTSPVLTTPAIGSGGAVFSGSSSGTTTVKASAVAGTTTQTFPAVTGVVASTTGTNLYVADIYRTSAPVTANATVTPATVTGLSGSVAVGTYAFNAYLPSTVASGTGGIAYNFLLTTAVLSAFECTGTGNTSAAVATQHTTTATSGTAVFTQAAVVIQTILRGTFTVSTAGTFAIQMCQNTSNASDTIALLGGYLELVRIA